MSEALPASSELSAGRGRWWLSAVTLALAIVTAYSNSLVNAFQFDDFATIQTNIFIRRLDNLPRFFTDATTYSTSPRDATYRPLAAATFALDYAWGGGANPAAFHVTQLLLHLLMTAGVWLLLRRVLRGAGSEYADGLALFGTALFGLHRVNTEAVNYITARSEIIAALGVVFSLVGFARGGRLRSSYLWLLPMAVAAFAKPAALIFPLLLLAYAVLLEGAARPGGNLAALRGALRYFLPALGLACGLFVFINMMNGPLQNYGQMSRTLFVQSQPRSWLYYLWLFICPWPLSADHGWKPLYDWRDAQVLGYAALLPLLAFGAVVYARRRPFPGRLFLFGAAGYAIGLLPTSSVIPLDDLMREYRLYLPSAGLCFCAVALAAECARLLMPLRGGRSVLLLSGAAVLVLHGAGTYQRNRVWRTDLTLWQSATDASPENGRAWQGLAIAHLNHGRPDAARTCLERQVDAGYNTPTLELNYALVELADGRTDLAERHFQRAILMAPRIGDVHLAYGAWLRKNGRREEALIELRQVLQLSPANLFGRHELLQLYEEAGQRAEYCTLALETLSFNDDPALARRVSEKCAEPVLVTPQPPPS